MDFDIILPTLHSVRGIGDGRHENFSGAFEDAAKRLIDAFDALNDVGYAAIWEQHRDAQLREYEKEKGKFAGDERTWLKRKPN